MTDITVRDENGKPVTVCVDAFFIFGIRDNNVCVLRSDRLDCVAAEMICHSMYQHAKEIEGKLPMAIIDAVWEQSAKKPEDFAHWLNGIFNLSREAGCSPYEP